MNDEMEFHDSTLAEIARDGCDVVIRFRPAYVRKQIDGVAGGYEQDVDLRIMDARSVPKVATLPAWIADASLRIGDGESLDALLPLPFKTEGSIRFSGSTAEGESFSIEGTAISAAASGEYRYIEKLP